MPSLARRLELLEELIRATEQRVPEELAARATGIVHRADQRLRLGEQTVVALAGATGSGKSSLTNALAGTDITAVGVRRPTTSKTLAISFGASNPALLDWLRIPRRHDAIWYQWCTTICAGTELARCNRNFIFSLCCQFSRLYRLGGIIVSLFRK